METTIVAWGYLGIVEKKMETTMMDYIGYILGLYNDNGQWKKTETTVLYRRYIRVLSLSSTINPSLPGHILLL